MYGSTFDLIQICLILRVFVDSIQFSPCNQDPKFSVSFRPPLTAEENVGFVFFNFQIQHISCNSKEFYQEQFS